PLSQPLQQTINVTSVHPTEDVTRSIERQQKQKLLLGETGSQVWFVLQYERHENNLDYRATCIINGIPMQLKITGNDLPDFAQQEPQNGDFGTTQIHDLLLETGTKQMLKDIAGKLLASGNRIIQDKRAELGELGALKMLTQLDTLEDEIQTAVESELNQIPEIQILQEAGFTISLRSKGLVEIAITRDPLPHPPQAELFAWTKLFQSTPPTPSREDVAQTHAQ
ncbi:MAG TPA: hypothetical protein VIT68_04155, partial [Candidatus Gracilibacteria bacterium]